MSQGRNFSLFQKAAAEAVGAALLLAAVVGSGIMGERLSGGNVALALLANSLATGAALLALISSIAPLSGAHFNPLVSWSECFAKKINSAQATIYTVAQFFGALLGVATANLMFDAPAWDPSTKARAEFSLLLSESIATFGLLVVIFCTANWNPTAVPISVAGYITAAYWFTSSTSFANPAVTVARSLTNSFSGIQFSDVPAFVLAQLIGAFCAWSFFRWLNSSSKRKEV